MSVVSSAPPTMVDFPAEETSPGTAPPSNIQRPPYLQAFRRISLPTPPTMIHRRSVASMSSSDSLAEDPSSETQAAQQPVPLGSVLPTVMRNVAGKSRPTRPTSMEQPRRANTKLRTIDESREAKRRKIVLEFYETERSYVDGLELIYSHFLSPVIATLETSHPLLTAPELTAIFANFVDIWNLHRRFFSALSDQLLLMDPPPLSSLLLSHFPYLSLYNPFVTSFPAALTSLNSLSATKPAFAAFLRQQEADERCRKLRLQAWLLTIVQRCPRYLLLLKDLIGCTDAEDSEHAALTAAHTLVSKITNSLNTSLHTHAQTLALLALQRSTPNLPFQLISPGRTLIKRGPLLQLEGPGLPKEREFLLFSDCFIWIESADRGPAEVEWGSDKEDPSPSSAGLSPSVLPSHASGTRTLRPPMVRSRSKSDPELLLEASASVEGHGHGDPSPRSNFSRSRSNVSALVIPKAKQKKKVRMASASGEERWVYKGRTELVDLEVVVAPLREDGDERRLEILSPEMSFALYAANEEERDDWSAAIRTAKGSLLMTLNAMHPNSTLTSSTSNAHLRRTLQAIPHLPEEEESGKKPKRGKVEHFVPAIWIPDAKTESCMRCSRAFGWRRRRHHCRLCGRCVCGSCSQRTFYVTDPSDSSKKNKPARACETCYEAVFPIVEEPSPAPSQLSQAPPTVSTLSGFPSWQSISMPSLAMPRPPSALMAIDIGSPRDESYADEGTIRATTPAQGIIEGSPPSPKANPRIRLKSTMRPKSYVQILEDFQQEGQGQSPRSPSAIPRTLSQQSKSSGERDEADLEALTVNLTLEDDAATGAAVTFANAGSPKTPRKEDTARRSKRFSMPAMALQTTPVHAHTKPGGTARSKRFSLVLSSAGARSGGTGTMRRRKAAHGPAQPEAGGKVTVESAAASKLSELLGRKKE